MENSSWQTVNRFWLDYQQEIIGVGIAVLALVVIVALFRFIRREKPHHAATSEAAAEQTSKQDGPVSVDAGVEVSEPEDAAQVKESEAPRVREQELPRLSLAERFRRGLSKTGRQFNDLFRQGIALDENLLEELETHLLMADVGVEVTESVMETLRSKIKSGTLGDAGDLQKALKSILLDIVKPCEAPFLVEGTPTVIMVVGVNGVGKTTTIGKLANYYRKQDKKVLLAAGDTFRAAAVEQLQEWGQRNEVPVVAQHTGADSASVIYDAIESAKTRNIDLVIADTAGRLHNKSNLMEELKKIKRVAGKLDPSAPQEVLLVVDAGTGQNALSQMQEFSEAAGVTGVVVTKLDGTAKGGVIFPLCRKYATPIRFVGLGESIDDLQPFKADTFVEALFPAE